MISDDMKFKIGDEVLVIGYPDKEVIDCTGTVTGWDGRYWNVTLDADESDEEDPNFLFETGELELNNKYYKYNPKQAGDTDDDI
jgi:hypothetical protein